MLILAINLCVPYKTKDRYICWLHLVWNLTDNELCMFKCRSEEGKITVAVHTTSALVPSTVPDTVWMFTITEQVLAQHIGWIHSSTSVNTSYSWHLTRWSQNCSPRKQTHYPRWWRAVWNSKHFNCVDCIIKSSTIKRLGGPKPRSFVTPIHLFQSQDKHSQRTISDEISSSKLKQLIYEKCSK